MLHGALLALDQKHHDVMGQSSIAGVVPGLHTCTLWSELWKWVLCPDCRIWGLRVTAVAAGKGMWFPHILFLSPSKFLWDLSVHLRFNLCCLYGTFSPSLTP